jgi:hydroxymethylpyrimidine kinase/phosphomethylpyrimidine kinase
VSAIVLSIGTSHPWNVAGVGRDIVVGSALDARVFTAIAAVSAQDAGGVTALEAISPDLFAAQLRVLPWQSAGAVRVGALPDADAVRSVAEAVRGRPWLPWVVDPVFAASRGGALGAEGAFDTLGRELAVLPAVVLTPNLAEATRLLQRNKIDRDELPQAARDLRERGASAVLLTGGHLAGDPTDALAWREGEEIFSESRIAGSMHGTGCTLAMALACHLAAGESLPAAVRAARAFVRAELARH